MLWVTRLLPIEIVPRASALRGRLVTSRADSVTGANTRKTRLVSPTHEQARINFFWDHYHAFVYSLLTV